MHRFGVLIRDLRLARGLMQSEVAKAVGESRAHISRLEIGKRLPTINEHKVKPWAEVLGATEKLLLDTAWASRPIPIIESTVIEIRKRVGNFAKAVIQTPHLVIKLALDPNKLTDEQLVMIKEILEGEKSVG